MGPPDLGFGGLVRFMPGGLLADAVSGVTDVGVPASPDVLCVGG